MIFIKGFHQYQSGFIQECWINLQLIKSLLLTDFYDNKLGKNVPNVLKCDMGIESSDKVPYIDLNKPVETKTITDIVKLYKSDAPVIDPDKKPIARRGRPPKNRD